MAIKESTKQIIAESGFDVNAAVELSEVEKLTKDMKTKIIEIGYVSRSELKAVYNTYMQVQDMRIALTEQIRSIENGNTEDSDLSITILRWTLKNMASIEKSLLKSLTIVCENNEVGRWLLATTGIGPSLAAGCLAYFDVRGKEYATQFHSYAGLNDNNRPWRGKEEITKIVNDIVGSSKVITDDHVALIAAKTQWSYSHIRDRAWDDKKEKWSKANIISACSMVPYNKELKSFCYLLGEQFHWNCNNDQSLYGTLFSERKALEEKRNAEGAFSDQASNKLDKLISKDTNAYKAYSEGKLPAAHINNRAKRWAVKIFISHLFEEMYRVEYGEKPPRYYALDKLEGMHNKLILPEVPFTPVNGEPMDEPNIPANYKPKKEEKIKYECDCGGTKAVKYSPIKCKNCGSRLHKIEE